MKVAVRSSLGSLTVGGSVSEFLLVAGGGFDAVRLPANPDAQVGTVKVTGDWTASSVVVGALAGSDGIFGTLDDKLAGGGAADVVGTIARVQIKGSILGGFTQTGVSAFIAQHVTALSVGGSAIPLKVGAGNDTKFLDKSATSFVRENNAPLD